MEIRKRAPELADSALAALSISLAGEIDNSDNSATSKAACAKALHDTLNTLRELAPPEGKKGQLHDLKSARSRRLTKRGAGS